MKDIGIFSNSQKRLSLLHPQVSDKCPDSSRSLLKRNCSTKWIENCDVFVFKEFFPAVVGSLDQLSESRDGEAYGRAMPYLKTITTTGFLVSLEVIKCYSETYQNSCKEATEHQEIILTALDATSIAICKDAIQGFYMSTHFILRKEMIFLPESEKNLMNHPVSAKIVWIVLENLLLVLCLINHKSFLQL